MIEADGVIPIDESVERIPFFCRVGLHKWIKVRPYSEKKLVCYRCEKVILDTR